jgi:5-methylcytosine-specific restriction endonuclease McrA
VTRLSSRPWYRLRLLVLERDGWTCQRCGAPATDCGHLIPAAHGGPDTPDNLQAECARCNRADGHTIANQLTPTAAGWDW